LFLNTAKWLFISRPSQLALARIIEKRAKNHPKSQTTSETKYPIPFLEYNYSWDSEEEIFICFRAWLIS
jgi:hypothetical protein